MTDSQGTSELIDQIRDAVGYTEGMALEGAEGIEQMAAVLRELAHPDFVTVMVPKEGPAVEHPGVHGFSEALGDWITPYERFRLIIDRVVTAPDKLVFLARQVGTTKHGGVEVETESASVWSFVEGGVVQATFYLDRPTGLRAAGLDPDDYT